MNVLFVENRYKTYFWDAVAGELIRRGEQVYWVVQNKAFMPKNGLIKAIPYPRRGELSRSEDLTNFKDIEHIDRGVNYFSGTTKHYSYYYRQIDDWLTEINPDYVVGECTLFHEHMVIHWCEEHGVRYFHPSMPGYPGGRYAVYRSGTKEAVAGEECELTAAELGHIVEAVISGQKRPHYMAPIPKMIGDRKYPVPGSFRDRVHILCGYILGERFNTPSPIRKLALDSSLRKQRNLLRNLSREWSGTDARKKYVLYAMQVQPEANVDVWGRKFRDQTQLIRELSDNLPSDWVLLLKVHPKAKYELTSELIELCERSGNISLLHLAVPMQEALNFANIVCTVTGTVAIEAVLSGVPLVSFGPIGVPLGAGGVALSSARELRRVIHQVELGQFTVASMEDKIALIRRLYSSTFEGWVSDPATMPDVINESNVMRVAGCLMEIARRCD